MAAVVAAPTAAEAPATRARVNLDILADGGMQHVEGRGGYLIAAYMVIVICEGVSEDATRLSNQSCQASASSKTSLN